MEQMTDKVVIVTGASRGIGEAAARAFVAAGAKVALLARSGEHIGRIAGELGPAAIAIPCDVSRYWEVEAAVAATLDTFGRLDVFIANAGVVDPMAPLTECDPDVWGKTIDINLKGVFHGMRAALPVLPEGGTFITISSGAAHNPVEGWSAYCASKAGAYMLTRMAHEEGAGRGIRALGLSPGTVATDMQAAIKASGVGPVAKLDWSIHIQPDWPACALVWMCGPDADEFLGTDVSLRDPAIRRRVGLV